MAVEESQELEESEDVDKSEKSDESEEVSDASKPLKKTADTGSDSNPQVSSSPRPGILSSPR